MKYAWSWFTENAHGIFWHVIHLENIANNGFTNI